MAVTSQNLSLREYEYPDAQPDPGVVWGWREGIQLYGLLVVVAISSLALTVLLLQAVPPLISATELLPGWVQQTTLLILSGERIAVTTPTLVFAGAFLANLIAVIIGLAAYQKLLG